MGNGTYYIASEALDEALRALTRSVALPVPTRTLSGQRSYRFPSPSFREALVVKCVRMLSALKALGALIDQGLMLDAGSMMRISDEVGLDIMFLAGPELFHQPFEERHKKYLTELFQEEFGPGDRLSSQLKRDRVSRKHIRAYVARTYSEPTEVSRAVAVTETVEGVFSGFIHGAGVHIMDIFNGEDFTISLPERAAPLRAIKEQFPHYIQRTMMGFCFSAKAIGREDVFEKLYQLNITLFEDDGRPRTSGR